MSLFSTCKFSGPSRRTPRLPVDIFGPVAQAGRCLDRWLKEEGRQMPFRLRRRAAAMIARYFVYEDDVTDELLMSFLRHYSGMKEIDMDDPTSVRMEIKTLLDEAARPAANAAGWRMAALGLAAAIVVGAVWAAPRVKITPAQQLALKQRVEHIVRQDAAATHAAVWAEVKRPLDVRRYQDIAWIDYPAARRRLDARLAQGTAD